MNKTIWLFWKQEFKNAPHLVQRCKDIWIQKNPDWDVILLDHNNVMEYVPDLTKKFPSIEKYNPRVFSDALRFELLKHHGGVWSDPTTYCVTPLSEYVLSHDVTIPKYQSKPYRLISNWFMTSMNNNILFDTWHTRLVQYWKNNKCSSKRLVPYFWTHDCFINLHKNNKNFKKYFYDKCNLLHAEHSHYFCPYGTTFSTNGKYKTDLDFLHQKSPVQKLTWKQQLKPNSTIDRLLK